RLIPHLPDSDGATPVRRHSIRKGVPGTSVRHLIAEKNPHDRPTRIESLDQALPQTLSAATAGPVVAEWIGVVIAGWRTTRLADPRGGHDYVHREEDADPSEARLLHASVSPGSTGRAHPSHTEVGRGIGSGAVRGCQQAPGGDPQTSDQQSPTTAGALLRSTHLHRPRPPWPICVWRLIGRKLARPYSSVTHRVN